MRGRGDLDDDRDDPASLGHLVCGLLEVGGVGGVGSRPGTSAAKAAPSRASQIRNFLMTRLLPILDEESLRDVEPDLVRYGFPVARSALSGAARWGLVAALGLALAVSGAGAYLVGSSLGPTTPLLKT